MTRKDYEAIAAKFRSADLLGIESQFDQGYEAARCNLAKSLAQTLKADNPRFDRAKFLQACGVPQ